MADLKICANCDSKIAATITLVCPECLDDPDQARQIPNQVAEKPAQAALVEIAVAGVRIRINAEESVLLGRLGDSRVATALARFDNVSRRHATIRALANGSIEACDVESRNGTFVGDLRLDPHTPVELPLPTTIRLARFCFVDLRAAP